MDQLFQLLKPGIIPPKITHIVWDYDGVLTDKRDLNPQCLKLLANLGKMGVKHAFVSGRESDFLKKNIFSVVDGEHIGGNFVFLGELGATKSGFLQETHWTQDWKNHPIMDPDFRQEIRTLFSNWEYLSQIKESEAAFQAMDYRSRPIFFPKNPNMPFPEFEWYEEKTVVMSVTAIRDAELKTIPSFIAKRGNIAQTIEKIIEKRGLQNYISVVIAATAIDIAPKINGRIMEKDHGSAVALSHWITDEGKNPIAGTVCFGDSRADIKMCEPFNGKTLGNMPIFFVGRQDEYEQIENSPLVAAASLGALGQNPDNICSQVTIAILQWLMENEKF